MFPTFAGAKREARNWPVGTWVSITNAAIAARTNELPDDFSGDPFDRTIIATAAVLDLTLVTTDPAIRDAGVCAVEYYPFKANRPSKRRR